VASMMQRGELEAMATGQARYLRASRTLKPR